MFRRVSWGVALGAAFLGILTACDVQQQGIPSASGRPDVCGVLAAPVTAALLQQGITATPLNDGSLGCTWKDAANSITVVLKADSSAPTGAPATNIPGIGPVSLVGPTEVTFTAAGQQYDLSVQSTKPDADNQATALKLLGTIGGVLDSTAAPGTPAPADGSSQAGASAPAGGSTPAGASAPAGGSTSGGGSSPGGGSSSGGGSPAAPGGPAVVSFSVSKPTCKAGAPTAPVTLTWKVTGADNATEELDDSGQDIAYPPTHSVTLDFPCDGKAHAYHVWPGGDQAAMRTVTVTAAGGGSGGDPNTVAVVSFSASRPTCKAGAPTAPVTLTWNVTGADNATEELDDSGQDIAYPPTHSATVDFPCDGKAHAYHVWPGGDQGAMKTVTVTAANS